MEKEEVKVNEVDEQLLVAPFLRDVRNVGRRMQTL